MTKDDSYRDKNNILDVASDLYKNTGIDDENLKSHIIENQFRHADTNKDPKYLKEIQDRLFTRRIINVKNAELVTKDLQKKILRCRSFVTDKTAKFYFSNAQSVKDSALLQPGQNQFDSSKTRLQVIDLPSIDEDRFRLLTVSTLVEAEWARSRQGWEDALTKNVEDDTRFPTFIVVDEAHNLIPFDPRGFAEKRLLEQFRTIAAEGRKFGLFLILVSQRPDKLDRWVLSECANQAIMKIGSKGVAADTAEALGIKSQDKNPLDDCVKFKLGRALLRGPWATDGPPWLYSAMRRTEEGGRNLREEHWATPFADDEEVKNPADKGETAMTNVPTAATKTLPAHAKVVLTSK